MIASGEAAISAPWRSFDWRRASNCAAESIAVAAWFANARSAWSWSVRGSRRSEGSSAQMKPIVAPVRSASGTISQWWFQARAPRPFRSET